MAELPKDIDPEDSPAFLLPAGIETRTEKVGNRNLVSSRGNLLPQQIVNPKGTKEAVMKTRTILRRFRWLLLLAVISTVACGGGGSGGDSPAPTAISYSGVTDPAMITDQNAADLALFAVMGAFLGADVGFDFFPALKGTGAYVASGNCGGTAEVEFNYDEQTGAIGGSLLLEKYCSDEAEYSGTVDLSGEADSLTDKVIQWQFAFKSLTMIEDNEPMTLNGEVSLVVASLRLSIDIVARDDLDGKVYWINGIVLNFSEGVGFEEIDVSGRFYHPDYGYIDLSTTTPLVSYDGPPSEGVVQALGGPGTSGDNTKSHLTFLPLTRCKVEADTDGDGAWDWFSGTLMLDGTVVPPDAGEMATVTGTLSLPMTATCAEWVVAIDNDTDGDNGFVAFSDGTCGSSEQISYTIVNVPAGTYYLYAVAFLEPRTGGPIPGDYLGFYPTGLAEPTGPNTLIPDTGMVNFDIPLWLIPGGVEPDITPPTTPSGFVASNISSSQILLSWNASDDAVGVSGYELFRDGILLVSVAETTYFDPALVSETEYCYTVKAFDEAGNKSAMSSPICATTLIIPFTTFTMPDTGQVLSYSEVFGEDSDYSINPLSYQSNGNGTITDNATKLMWQQEDDGIRKTWYDAKSYCSNLELGSHGDWRLPVDMELISIVHYDQLNLPAIDINYFLNVSPIEYWTATSVGGDPNSAVAWCINFSDGQCRLQTFDEEGRHIPYLKTDPYYARCVRGTGFSSQSFSDNGNGTVVDNVTGLEWQQGEGPYQTLESALTYCQELDLDGSTDWRLPNVKALKSLTDTSRPESPSINTLYFPEADGTYWSSTRHRFHFSIAWGVTFGDGHVHYTDIPDNYLNTRCVRGGN